MSPFIQLTAVNYCGWSRKALLNFYLIESMASRFAILPLNSHAWLQQPWKMTGCFKAKMSNLHIKIEMESIPRSLAWALREKSPWLRNQLYALRKKYPYSELFWSVFSRIRTEYGEIRSDDYYRKFHLMVIILLISTTYFSNPCLRKLVKNLRKVIYWLWNCKWKKRKLSNKEKYTL